MEGRAKCILIPIPLPSARNLNKGWKLQFVSSSRCALPSSPIPSSSYCLGHTCHSHSPIRVVVFEYANFFSEQRYFSIRRFFLSARDAKRNILDNFGNLPVSARAQSFFGEGNRIGFLLSNFSAYFSWATCHARRKRIGGREGRDNSCLTNCSNFHRHGGKVGDFSPNDRRKTNSEERGDDDKAPSRGKVSSIKSRLGGNLPFRIISESEPLPLPEEDTYESW